MMGKIAKTFREIREELTKITWPTIPSTLRLTGIVLVVCVVVGVFLALLDFGYTKGLEQLLVLKNKIVSTSKNTGTTTTPQVDLGTVETQTTPAK